MWLLGLPCSRKSWTCPIFCLVYVCRMDDIRFCMHRANLTWLHAVAEHQISRLVSLCCSILASSHTLSIDMERSYITPAQRIENHKRSVGYAVDDRRIQERSN